MKHVNREVIVLGGGCFWCLEAVFGQLRGVIRVASGYAGGHVLNPTYHDVCGKRSGHAEVVHITFNSLQIPLRDLFEVFFTAHDPTTPNRQGADAGPQYRSIILYHTPQQKQLAEQVIAELNKEKIWAAPIVTEIQPLDAFYRAEAEHEQYYQRNPDQAYCKIVIEPKIAKLREQHMDKLSNKQIA